MMKILFERRLVYLRSFNENSRRDRDRDDGDDGLDKYAKSMENGNVHSSDEVRNIMKGVSELRASLAKSSLLSEKDQEIWHEKLEKLKDEPDEFALKNLKEEFASEQREIKQMVDKYTQKVISHKESAFAVDETRGVDTTKEYLDWFMSLSKDEKDKALFALDAEINERVTLRQQIIKLNPNLKNEVVKMDRTEMKTKLKELEIIDKNIQQARELLTRDKKYSSGIEEQLKHFADHTPEEQTQRLRGYERYFLKPRKDVVDKYESIPAEIRNASDLPSELQKNFYNLRLKEKQEFIEQLEDYIEEKFTKSVNNLPNETWSLATKRFAIQSFMQLTNIKDKAERLLRLPEFIKAEQNLTNEYKRFDPEVQKMPDYSIHKWEKADFEEKQRMLEQMETDETLLKTLKSLLTNRLKKNIISQSTYNMYLNSYMDGTTRERAEAFKNFGAYMAPREALLEDFNNLDEETKSHFGREFLIHGYQTRLKIYKQAKEYEQKNAKQAGRSDTSKDTIKKEPVVKTTPKTEDIKENTEPQLNAQGREELEAQKILEEILEDQKEVAMKEGGKENLADQNTQFGEDRIKRGLNEEIVAGTGGKKMLNEKGRMEEVHQIDVTRFGRDEGQKFRVAKQLREMADNKNFRNVQLRDEKGVVLTTQRAELKLKQRKKRLNTDRS